MSKYIKKVKVTKCVWCHKDFLQHHGSQKYCSKECKYERDKQYRHEWWMNNFHRNMRECKRCRKSFRVQYKNQTYCSDKCKEEYYKEYHKKYRKTYKYVPKHPDPEIKLPKKCRQCGKEFIPRIKTQLYDSPQCRRKAKWERNKNKPRKYMQTPEYKARKKEYDRYYRSTKKGKIVRKAVNHRYRVRKKGIKADLTENQWSKILEHFNYRCAYCGKEKMLTQDHFIPVSKGGPMNEWNIVPACSSCNSKKGNKNPRTWLSKMPNGAEIYKDIRKFLDNQI